MSGEGGGGMKLIPLSWQQAKDFINNNHRHHRAPVGWKFGIGAEVDGKLVGVVVGSRPIARMLDDGFTLEITRLCTLGMKNVCSFLYSAAKRAALAMGFRRIITYILESDLGSSLKASGFRFVRIAGGGSWSRPSRRRLDKAPLERKQLWEFAK